MNPLTSNAALRMVIVLGLLPAGTMLAGQITYSVIVNTSAVAGTSGFIDFDFAPGNGSQAASVAIGGFSTDGALSGAPQVNGGVSGTLPAPLIIDNSTQFNDYFQGFDFGASISFLLSLDGPALTAPNGTSSSGSTFGFAMFDSTGTTPLLTTDPNGNAFTIDVNLDGTTTLTTFSTAATVTAVPEPSTCVLVLPCLIGLVRRKPRR